MQFDFFSFLLPFKSINQSIILRWIVWITSCGTASLHSSTDGSKNLTTLIINNKTTDTWRTKSEKKEQRNKSICIYSSLSAAKWWTGGEMKRRTKKQQNNQSGWTQLPPVDVVLLLLSSSVHRPEWSDRCRICGRHAADEGHQAGHTPAEAERRTRVEKNNKRREQQQIKRWRENETTEVWWDTAQERIINHLRPLLIIIFPIFLPLFLLPFLPFLVLLASSFFSVIDQSVFSSWLWLTSSTSHLQSFVFLSCSFFNPSACRLQTSSKEEEHLHFSSPTLYSLLLTNEHKHEIVRT